MLPVIGETLFNDNVATGVATGGVAADPVVDVIITIGILLDV